jgi:hypothetical protein
MDVWIRVAESCTEIRVAESCTELYFTIAFRTVGCFLAEFRSIYHSVQESDQDASHLLIMIPV